MRNLNSFFNPKSIAVVGASHDPGKIGHVVLKNFTHSTFKGKIYPVNPDTQPILGFKTYASVRDIPGSLDLAIITIPGKFVAQALEDCGRKKVKAVTIISSGFKEVGGEGIQKEEELKKIIKKYNLNVIGPNCLGVFDSSSGVDMLFLPSYRLGRPGKGVISFITQSGAFGSTILDWSAQEGFGMSKFISYGNAADVDESDLLDYLGNDSETKVITMYVEGVSRARELMRVSSEVSKNKPILAFKAGRSKRGTLAAQSHTGSLAGADEIYTAAFKQSGIIRVHSTEEMFDYARALAFQPLLKGKRIAIITDGGGFGVMATDAAEDAGLEVAELSSKTKALLKKKLLPYASVHNPVDITGSANGDMYTVATEACLADPNVDGVLVILLFQPPNIESDVVQNMLNINAKSKKPMLVCSAGGAYTQVHRDILDRSGVPTFSTPQRAIKAMAVLNQYYQIKQRK